MKTYIYPFLLLVLALLTACNKDTPDNVLHYDGENFSGPLLPAGANEAAVLFPADITSAYRGRQMVAVRYYMGAKPLEAQIRIYGEGAPGFPGAELYSAVITDEVRTLQWSEHSLTTPVEITGDDLWISIQLVHAGEQQSIGCDAGPNVRNGDWLFLPSDGNWETYINRTGESVNWNIRGILSE